MLSPAAWRFHARAYGLPHVILDSDRRILVAHVPPDNGPLIVATPTMFAVMQRIAAELPKGVRLGDLARRAIGLVEGG